MSAASKPLAENEATGIPQPGAERGPGLEGKIIVLVVFIRSECFWRAVEDREILYLLQAAGLEALEMGTKLQWDYEQKCRLQDKTILKRKEKTQTCTSSRSLEKPLFSARKYLPSASIDQVDAELHKTAKSCEFEQLTAGLIREHSIIGITDNQD